MASQLELCSPLSTALGPSNPQAQEPWNSLHRLDERNPDLPQHSPLSATERAFPMETIMALTGLHVVCAYPGSTSPQNKVAPTLGRPIWSETLSSPGPTTQASPGTDWANGLGDCIFHIRAAADSYAAIGPSPNASTGTRVFVPAGEFVTVYVTKGDKLAWIAA